MLSVTGPVDVLVKASRHEIDYRGRAEQGDDTHSVHITLGGPSLPRHVKERRYSWT